MPESQRNELWRIFAEVRARLESKGVITESSLYSDLARHYKEERQKPYDFIVVDEAQDMSVAQLRFFAAFGSNEPNRLFFAGDLGQRIFQTPFSWKTLGIDIRGRSTTLKINYRTSHQIKKQADRLLSTDISDVDGNIEIRKGTVSVFNGPEPIIKVLEHETAEADTVSQWISSIMVTGVNPSEIGVFVRSSNELDRAIRAVQKTGLPYTIMDDNADILDGKLSIGTMHLAKGLEFKAVAVMACDEEVIPSQERIEGISDEGDLEDVYNTERHLLYVACTRARDSLLVTGAQPGSEFLDDLVN